MNKHIFIAWIDFQRRAHSMKSYFQFNLYFFKRRTNNKRFKIIDYVLKAIETVVLLIKEKPNILWTQLPPTPLIKIITWYKRYNKSSFIIADCHNAIISNKWKPYFKDYTILNAYDLIIVHNHVIKERLLQFNIDTKKLAVLETRPASISPNLSDLDIRLKQKQVLMPCSFAKDEPLDIVFEAAKLIPEVTILISGNKNRAKGVHDLTNCPNNIRFTGYLSNNEYEKLFLESSAVIGLTTEDHIQLSVANEAVGFGKPMVLSNTKLLQELFYKGAVFVNSFDSYSLSKGIKECIESYDILKLEVQDLKNERHSRWEQQATLITNRISKKTITHEY